VGRGFNRAESVLISGRLYRQAAKKSGQMSFGAPILREESLLVFGFESGGIPRFARNENQSTFSAT
jgi:hypothetical protein